MCKNYFPFSPYHILLPTPLFQLFFTLFPLLLFLLGPGANGGRKGFGIVKSFPCSFLPAAKPTGHRTVRVVVVVVVVVVGGGLL